MLNILLTVFLFSLGTNSTFWFQNRYHTFILYDFFFGQFLSWWLQGYHKTHISLKLDVSYTKWFVLNVSTTKKSIHIKKSNYRVILWTSWVTDLHLAFVERQSVLQHLDLRGLLLLHELALELLLPVVL